MLSEGVRINSVKATEESLVKVNRGEGVRINSVKATEESLDKVNGCVTVESDEQ